MIFNHNRINVKDSYFKYINAMIKILRSRNNDHSHNVHEMIKINRVLISILKNF